ncbi:redoxin domain-containing protein [Pedobacter panaciterrae]
MLKKTYLVIIALLGLHLIVPAQTVTIQGNLIGLTENQLQFVYNTSEGYKVDTIYVTGGKFTWSKKLSGPRKAMLFLPENSFPFFIEPGNIRIEGKPDSVVVIGSKTYDESIAYSRSFKDLQQQRDSIRKAISNAPTNEQPALQEKQLQVTKMWTEMENAYIKSHPMHVISSDIAARRASMGDYDEALLAFNLLDRTVQESPEGKEIASALAIGKRSRMGARVPDFIQNDPEGRPVNFASFRGKYVFIDFWSSSCVPCRAENPNILKAYNKYKDKNFTVLGVSLDDNIELWKNAIKEDKMPWTMVSDLKGLKNEVSSYFGIFGIPRSLLIDTEGKIIAKDLRGDELKQKLDELFSSN